MTDIQPYQFDLEGTSQEEDDSKWLKTLRLLHLDLSNVAFIIITAEFLVTVLSITYLRNMF